MPFVRSRTRVLPVVAFSAMLAAACSDALAPDPTGVSTDKRRPPVDTTTTVVQPPPPTTTGSNPFAGYALYVDPYSNAKKQADAWRSSRPADASQMDKIATQSQADWFGSWNSDIRTAVDARTTTITNAGKLPVFVAYNIPKLDCGSGGAVSADAYRSWISAFAAGIGTRKAVVILEPDALAAMSCLSTTDQTNLRTNLIHDAVKILKAQPAVAVYMDAGHSNWMSVATMVTRLTAAGIAEADGFSLNVSNFEYNSNLETYGTSISAGVGNKHFVFDTSRNGAGPGSTWCNPDGRALGSAPTTNTGKTLVDAVLWIKRPGESDGTCNGGPSGGAWWADYALGMAQRSNLTAAVRPMLAAR